MQILAYVAKLTPEQIKLKQQQILNHVKQEAAHQNLSPSQADALLSETLSYNGLPQVNTNPLGGITSLIGQGINKIGLPASASSSSSSSLDTSHTPGLPVPGTWEHTVTLALFNAQQYLNTMFKSKPSQPAIDNKIGVAAGASETADSGIIGAVSSLPQSVTNAAVQVLKFVNPSSASAGTGDSGSQSYSEVVTGVDPTYAALGVLTTGALASVAYSYVASDADIASSATSLALGAVDAISRNDLVENIASSKLVQTASNALVGLAGNTPITDREYEAEYNDYYNYYNYDNIGYSDYDYNYEANRKFSHRDPLYEQTLPENTKLDKSSKVSDKIEWYEPGTGLGKDNNIPYVTYTEQHNPWSLMDKKKDTTHLYRSF